MKCLQGQRFLVGISIAYLGTFGPHNENQYHTHTYECPHCESSVPGDGVYESVLFEFNFKSTMKIAFFDISFLSLALFRLHATNREATMQEASHAQEASLPKVSLGGMRDASTCQPIS